MINLSISDILNRANSLLGKTAAEATVTYSSPVRRRTWASFLSDDKEERSIDHYYHEFFRDGNQYVSQLKLDEACILHGHGPQDLCATPFFCHQYGYWPKPTDHPMFVKNFLLKWKDVYEK